VFSARYELGLEVKDITFRPSKLKHLERVLIKLDYTFCEEDIGRSYR
jgi:hypothetical protein